MRALIDTNLGSNRAGEDERVGKGDLCTPGGQASAGRIGSRGHAGDLESCSFYTVAVLTVRVEL